MEKTGEYRKRKQVKPDQRNGNPPENKGAGAEQYASQEETSILTGQSNNNNTQV